VSTLAILDDRMAIWSVDRPIDLGKSEAIRAEFEAALPGWKIVIIANTAVIDLRRDESLAEKAAELHDAVDDELRRLRALQPVVAGAEGP